MAGKPRIPQEHWKGIAARYAAGEDAARIGADFGVARETVYRLVRRCGGEVSHRGGSAPIAEDLADRVCEEYLSGRGATSIAKQAGVTKRTVYNILTRRGIGTRPRSDRTGDTYHIPDYQRAAADRPRRGHRRGPRGAFNHSAFSVLDEEAAYWVGYLITDGCLGAYAGRSYRLTLPQARKHREQCEKLAVYLGSKLKILDIERKTFGEIRKFSVVSFTLPEGVAARLLTLGVRPAKTGVASAPEILRDNAAFWRGVIDGDGSVYTNRLCMNSSSPRLAGQFRRFASRVVGARNLSVYRNQAGVWGVRAQRVEPASVLARRLYRDATVALSGKYGRALQLMAKA